MLDQVLRPLDALLRQRVNDRLLYGDRGDDGHGSITHLFGWVDDVMAQVPLVDLEYFCDKFAELAAPLGLKLNPFKTRMLTSCNDSSILPTLRELNPALATDIENAIATYSVSKMLPPPRPPPPNSYLVSASWAHRWA